MLVGLVAFVLRSVLSHLRSDERCSTPSAEQDQCLGREKPASFRQTPGEGSPPSNPWRVGRWWSFGRCTTLS